MRAIKLLSCSASIISIQAASAFLAYSSILQQANTVYASIIGVSAFGIVGFCSSMFCYRTFYDKDEFNKVIFKGSVLETCAKLLILSFGASLIPIHHLTEQEI